MNKNNLKLFACAVAVVGAGTAFFSGAADAAAEAELRSVQVVPTSYQVPASSVIHTPDNYQKAGFCVSMDTLNTGTPTLADLTMDEAAELGAEYLWKIYELNLENATMFMRYNPGTETFPRAFWAGTALFSDTATPEATRWTFSVDAVTGELFNIGHYEKLDVSVSLGADSGLEKDFSSYAELAKAYAERCDLINGAVSQVLYNCQGYTGNVPDITLEVVGQEGERVFMAFSRYDKSLLGIATDSCRRIVESAWDDFEGEVMTVEFK